MYIPESFAKKQVCTIWILELLKVSEKVTTVSMDKMMKNWLGTNKS